MRFSLFLVIWACVWIPARADAELFALGLVHEGKEAYFDLRVKNETRDDLTFLTSSTTCDCVRVLALPSIIPAGESAIIPCAYLPTSVGRVAIEVKITSASREAAIKTFGLSGFVTKEEWLVSPEELIADTLGKFTIIDVREASKFSKTRIPRSINLPVFAIKTRQSLKGKAVVIVEDGAPSAEMLEEVQRLSSQGFRQVQILEGGLASWLRKTGGPAKTGSSVLIVAGITPSEYDRSTKIHPWQVVQADDLSDLAKMERAIGHAREYSKTLNILVVAEQEEFYAATESRLAPQGKTQAVYYLRGGKRAMDDWRRSVAELKANPTQIVQVAPASAHPVTSRCGACPAK